jgi:hypothetical protein
MLKWQCFFSPVIAALVGCFSIGVAELTKDGDFFQNATRVESGQDDASCQRIRRDG